MYRIDYIHRFKHVHVAILKVFLLHPAIGIDEIYVKKLLSEEIELVVYAVRLLIFINFVLNLLLLSSYLNF